jgi:hypothetical protein
MDNDPYNCLSFLHGEVDDGGVNHLGLWTAFPEWAATSAQAAWWPECLISVGPECTGRSDRIP